MADNIDITIIMPSYNSERFISESIDSVINQSLKNWELIIVDDNSSDGSIDIVNNFISKDKRITLITLDENKGPAYARNIAIKKATGRFIAFLDSDDIWFPNKLDIQIKFMREKNLSLTYSAYEVINENGQKIGQFSPPLKITYTDMLKTSSIGCLTAIYDTKILGKVYMPNILKKQDYGLWLGILKKIKFTEGTPQYLAKYRLRENSVSSAKIRGGIYQWKIYREFENISLLKSLYYLAHYIKNGIVKYK